MSAAERRRVRVRGVVQGVGFRPFVHRTATALGLRGWVANDGEGVIAEAQGGIAELGELQRALREQAPAAAVVESVELTELASLDEPEPGFSVVAGSREPGTRTHIGPDLATCADCLRELRDPGDRRHRHPFITCTACGPRFTIVTALPYDRERTTMARFPLCEACRAEYEDPSDRRFHAEPICCPRCGPVLSLLDGAGAVLAHGEQALRGARERLAGGGIVAVKGVGGYHLACDAADGAAVARLREAKGREGKPLAVMVGDVEAARELGEVSEAEASLLTSRQAPIVLLRRDPRAPVDELVHAGSPCVGVLLAYTPVHHLLLEPGSPRVLVMTSGNRSEEPIAFEDGDAIARLGEIADVLLTHDRPIAGPCDDSVVRVCDHEPLLLRRSRGWAPLPVQLPFEVPEPLLAVGGELKAALALAEGREAFVGPHLGDMGDPVTLDALAAGARRLSGLLDVEPRALACDMHPGYSSARWAARACAGRPLHRVQHHHAHAAAVLAEHGRDPAEQMIALAFDGSGYGPDETVWGGEILLASCRSARRIAHLSPVPLPGGELAVRSPARMALAHLWAAGLPWDADLDAVTALGERERAVVLHQLETRLNAPLTTSAGRLFDAVAALCGVCRQIRFEGEAAMLLEGLAGDGGAAPPYRLEIDAAAEPAVIACAPVIAGVVEDVRAGARPERIAARLHATLSQVALDAARLARERHGLTTVALSGGVFQNVLLLDMTSRALREDGFEVLAHRLVPPGDGGLALGQVAVAAALEAGA